MKLTRFGLHLWWRILSFLALVLVRCFGLNRDGALLLSLKHSVLSDPLSALESWNYYDETPCSWRGVRCSASGMFGDPYPRVVALSLADSRLLGSIPGDLGMIEHLQDLDLSGNAFNGTLPFSLFNASQLQVMDLSDNLVSGELPEFGGGLQSLQLLNLSDNAFAGGIPGYLSTLSNLTTVSLKNNYFSGGLPTGFSSVEVLDLSSNLINGSLPSDFGGESLRYLNISYNRLSGEIPLEFAQNIPESAVLDLSFNNLTGEIPESNVLYNQETKSFAGNTGLCGKPMKTACPIPSTPYNSTVPTSPPAIAAMPKTIDSTPETTTGPGATNGSRENGLRPATVVGIVVGDIAGVGILAVIILYVYQWKKQRKVENATKTTTEKNETNSGRNMWSSSSSSPGESRKGITAWSCLPKRGEEEEESTETTSSEAEEERTMQTGHSSSQRRQQQEAAEKGVGALVTVDGGEKELELETLLKASAYILGATGTSIMYKAVLEDGTALAVRRIGESGVERFRDFENQVKTIAKLVHPNLVRIRGFYWGLDEKLVIYDFVPNGSLASARYRKIGSSPCHMPWEIRLKVAKGVARALNYLHDKKHVHGNLKPSNILLGADMDPKIGDFGLERLVSGETSYKAGASARNFGSKRSTASRDSFQEVPIGPSPSPSPSSLGVSPYHAPESLRSLKPNPKWDVFSFGVILLELLTGKVVVSDDLGLQGLAAEDKTRVLRMADAAIRADLEGREEALLACFKLGFNCVSPAPQKRPSMKDAVQVLDKIPSSSPSSSSYYYAH